MSEDFHRDVARERDNARRFGMGAVDTGTRAGRAAQYEEMGRAGGGGLVPLLLGLAVLTLWPILIVAVGATALHFTLRRWQVLNHDLDLWPAARRFYVSALASCAALAAAAFLVALFGNAFPTGSFADGVLESAYGVFVGVLESLGKSRVEDAGFTGVLARLGAQYGVVALLGGAVTLLAPPVVAAAIAVRSQAVVTSTRWSHAFAGAGATVIAAAVILVAAVAALA